MNIEEMLKKLVEDLRPALVELMKSAALECCSWCEEEVPFQIVGVYKGCALTQHSGGITPGEGKWKLFSGPMRDEPNGILRDYTGWGRLRFSYVDPSDASKNEKVIATKAADGSKVVIRAEDRRLLICPACLETSGFLTAKYYVSRDGCVAERVDPDPECKAPHHQGLVCACGWQG